MAFVTEPSRQCLKVYVDTHEPYYLIQALEIDRTCCLEALYYGSVTLIINTRSMLVCDSSGKTTLGMDELGTLPLENLAPLSGPIGGKIRFMARPAIPLILIICYQTEYASILWSLFGYPIRA